MNDPDILDIVKKTQQYLKQQGELFGEELFFKHPEVITAAEATENEKALNDFREAIKECQKCPLAQTRTHFVFGAGNPDANLMLIGEAPGRDEDLKGEPFVGKAGQLLDKTLAAIDFKREEVYIGNIIKCRPPGNRDPLPEEIALCLPYLLHQIEIIRPKVILTLGRISTQVLLKTNAPLSRLRGEVHDFNGIAVIATYHPAALLRNPQWKVPTWKDVQELRRVYDEIVGDKPEWHPPKR